jgi:selenide,water dikinase
VLRQLPVRTHPDVIVGTETSDDAGVFRLAPDLALVCTVDFFTPIVDDPYTFGQIAAANALSDVYAMGADPRTALNIVSFPKGTLDLTVLAEIMKGGGEKAAEAGVVVIGGHSIIDPELKYGMAVTGVVHPDRVIRNVGVKEGDALILTKPLGTGIVTTALKHRKASRTSVRAAVASMAALNDTASRIMRRFDVHACTDVTGYGLLGHAAEMAMGSGMSIDLKSSAFPLLPDAVRLAERGLITGGCGRNRAYLEDKVRVHPSVREGLVQVAFDPQTSGGLLIAVAKGEAPHLLDALQAGGVATRAVVGRATSPGKFLVTLS